MGLSDASQIVDTAVDTAVLTYLHFSTLFSYMTKTQIEVLVCPFVFYGFYYDFPLWRTYTEAKSIGTKGKKQHNAKRAFNKSALS